MENQEPRQLLKSSPGSQLLNSLSNFFGERKLPEKKKEICLLTLRNIHVDLAHGVRSVGLMPARFLDIPRIILYS